MTLYCRFVAEHPEQALHRAYHDTQYGFPLTNDAELFGRLILEINQAGLSWTTILKKQEAFRRAYDGFDIGTVASYGAADHARLMGDAGIIRNRLKINAAIENARRILALKATFGSFKGWLEAHHPNDLATWTKLFKKTFVFTGSEIVKEFLMSTGYLEGAHEEDCPVHNWVQTAGASWTRL
jgi:DNA-3-methyladenine glycosylase I